MFSHTLLGGLGNQLFQIFTTISIAIESKQSFYFKYQEMTDGITYRTTYWGSFLNKLKPYTRSEHPIIQNIIYIKELSFRYSSISFLVDTIDNNKTTLYLLDGYFQSYKYFENHFLQICDKIGIRTMQTELLPFFQDTTKQYKTTISMHFRLGDYKTLSLCHPIIPYEYYRNSLAFILQENDLKNICVLYFCENEDIEIVENNYLKGLKVEFPDCIFMNTAVTLGIQEDWKNLLLMSLCTHNIIANSSFSVWGAYFNQNTKKKVCYPSIWFGIAIPNDVSDIFPFEWYKISCYNI